MTTVRSTSPTALVIGGTGTTGSRVVSGLRQESAGVRVATRSPRAEDPAQVRFDWNDPATHGPAVAGVDRVYLIVPLGVPDPVPLVEPFLTGALRAGVRRVVLLGSSAIPEDESGIGALYRLVRTQSPEWTVLRPSWFMQNFTGTHPVAQGIRTRGEIVTATGSGRVAFVDAADIAAVAVRALLDAEPHDTEHLITGPEALSYADAARIVAEATGRPVHHRSISTAEYVTHLAATTGMPTRYAAVLAALDEDIRHGAENRTTATVQRVTGHPARPFAEFVAAALPRRA